MLMGRQVCGISLFQSIQAVQVFRAGRDFSLGDDDDDDPDFWFSFGADDQKAWPKGMVSVFLYERKRLKRTDRVPGLVV
jgi:hypothetical protein